MLSQYPQQYYNPTQEQVILPYQSYYNYSPSESMPQSIHQFESVISGTSAVESPVQFQSAAQFVGATEQTTTMIPVSE